MGEPAADQSLQHLRTLGRFTVDSPALASFAIRELCVSIARWYQDDGPIGPDQIAREYTEFALSIVGVGKR